jgi:hypothetical protein
MMMMMIRSRVPSPKYINASFMRLLDRSRNASHAGLGDENDDDDDDEQGSKSDIHAISFL